MALVGVALDQRAALEPAGQIGGQSYCQAIAAMASGYGIFVSLINYNTETQSFTGAILLEILKMFGKNMKLGLGPNLEHLLNPFNILSMSTGSCLILLPFFLTHLGTMFLHMQSNLLMFSSNLQRGLLSFCLRFQGSYQVHFQRKLGE